MGRILDMRIVQESHQLLAVEIGAHCDEDCRCDDDGK